MMQFVCPACKQKLQIQNTVRGKSIRCPKCKHLLKVPMGDSEEMGEDPNATESFATPPLVERKKILAENVAPIRSVSSRPPDIAGFTVLGELGRGGMGVVFKARENKLDRLVALKVMNASVADSNARQRFLREARMMAALEHQHIISIYQVGEHDGVPFLAMPLLQGESLQQRLRREGPLAVPEVLRIGREIAEGLAHAHDKRAIHRDIKPGNIWLEGERRRVKLLDFGLARRHKTQVHLTQSGAVVGTPAYMSPEQAAGKTIDQRSDLFSLGCVLYEMLTGTNPFAGPDVMATLSRLANEEAVPPHEIHSAIPPELSAFVMRLLAKDPAQRPASAQDVEAALHEMEQDPTAILTPPVYAHPQTTTPPQSNKTGRDAIRGLVKSVWVMLQNRPRFWLALLFGTIVVVVGMVALLMIALTWSGSGSPVDEFLPKMVHERHPGRICYVAYRPDGTTIAVCSGGTVYLRETRTLQLRDQVEASARGNVSWSSDGASIAVLDSQPFKSIRLWKFNGVKATKGISLTHDEEVTAFAFSPTQALLAAATKDGKIWLWNTTNAQCRKIPAAHKGQVNDLAFSGDGRRLATCGEDRQVCVWDLSGKQLARYLRPDAAAVRLVFHPKRDLLAFIRGGAWLWDVSHSKPPPPVRVSGESWQAIAFSPDNMTLATGGRFSADIHLWTLQPAECKETAVIRGQHEMTTILAYSPDGTYLAVGNRDGDLRILHVGKCAVKKSQ